MSAVQWQDILTAIKQVVQTEIRKETEKLNTEISKETEKLKAEISKETAKQTAVLDARLTAMSESLDRLNLVCENLKVEMRVENEKEAASLIDKFKTDNENLRQEISLEVQTESKNRSKEIELVRKENGRELNKLNNINAVSADIGERLELC
jgi:hypothetical protein